MPRVQHSLDYVELAAPDLEAQKAFYTKAFGWTFNDYGPDYVGYCDGREIDGKRAEAGGMFRAPATPGGPRIVLYSSDLEASRDAVRAAGGTITKDIFAFPGGRRFELTDPAGYALGVWSEQ